MPGLARRMSTTDAGFLYLERPNASLNIGLVAVLDRTLSLASVVDRFNERLPRMPRFRQCAVPVPFSVGHPTWEEQAEFALANHVFRWSLPAPGGEAELRELVAALLARPLDRSRPLWECHLIEGLEGDRCALFQKVHHCMIDGVSGANLLENLFDECDDAAHAVPSSRAEERSAHSLLRIGRALLDVSLRRTRALGAVVETLTRPAALRSTVQELRAAAYSAVQLATSEVPELPWNRPLGARRTLAFTRLPMERVRDIRALHGCSVNDVVLCVLAGGLHRYLEAHGISTRALEVTAAVPVSLRSPTEATALGNRISAMLVPLGVDLPGEQARLRATVALTTRLKQARAWIGIDRLLGALDQLPAPLTAYAGSRLNVKLGRFANVVATNVPGPRSARHLCGSRIEALYPIVPILDHIGLGLAVFSFDGTLYVGLNADPDHTPDIEKLALAIEDAFCALASGA